MAIMLVTGRDPVKRSLVYLAAIAVTVNAITLVVFLAFNYFYSGQSDSGKSGLSQVLEYIFVGLLAFLAIYVFLKRKEARKPKWMSTIQDADAKKVFRLGLTLYSFMPTDLITMLTVGKYLASNKMNFFSCFPFILLTILIAGLPLLFYLLFKKRA